MSVLRLFTDGSVNTRSCVGYGAYLTVSGTEESLESPNKVMEVRRFENTSSTKLELQTLLWALDSIQSTNRKIVIYTDSQNIVGLPQRRDRLEQNGYFSSKGRRLEHHKLYREFYKITDKLDHEIVKVRGHKASDEKNEIDHFFTLVDRASRKALRQSAS